MSDMICPNCKHLVEMVNDSSFDPDDGETGQHIYTIQLSCPRPECWKTYTYKFELNDEMDIYLGQGEWMESEGKHEESVPQDASAD